jgi:chromosome segregation ATPase
MAAASTPSSVNSSIDSMTGGATAAGAKNVNFLSQLEHMMSSVKKEAAALESMKMKLKDAEELKRKLDEAKSRLTTAEAENQQLRRMVKEADDQNIEIRNDMQRLNDIYYAERAKLTETQQMISRLEQEISGLKMEKDFFAKEAAKVPELKSAVKTGRSQMAALKKSIEDDRGGVEQKIAEVNKKCANLEKLNEDSGRHLFNMTETLTATQNQVRDLEDAAVAAATKLAAVQAAKAQASDRWLMTSEDLRLQVLRRPEIVLNFEERIGALKSELQKSKLLATSKTNEVFLLASEAKKLQEKLELGSQAYTNQINALQVPFVFRACRCWRCVWSLSCRDHTTGFLRTHIF